MKKILYFLLLTGILFQSCKKPLDEFTSDSQENIGDIQSRSEIETKDQEIVLGEKQANPLTPENMKQAWNNLYDEKLTSLEPSHKYVRFLPTLKEFKLLQDMDGLELIDYPFDRQIVRDGSYYHDPTIPEDQVTWQYAIVPMDFVSPVKNTEVLDEIVLVEYNSHWVQEAYRIKGLEYDGVPFGEYDSAAPTFLPPSGGARIIPPDDIECPPGCSKKLRRTDDPSAGPLQWEWYCDCTTTTNPTDPVSACGCEPSSNVHQPTGSVQVRDTQHNGGQWEGVEGVKIYVWRKNIVLGHLWGRSTHTDSNGCWKINREYKARGIFSGKLKPIKLGLRLKFKNDKVVARGMATKSDIAGYIEPVKDQMSRKAIDLRDFCIKYGPASGGEARKRYHAATAFNAFFEYNDYAEQDGVVPLDGIDILLHPFDAGGASTPMLDKMNGNLLNELATTFGVSTVLSAMIGPQAGTILGTAFGAVWVFAPDITYPYGSNNSDQIKETFYHEFAHASHFELQPKDYWKANISYVVKNFITHNNSPYGTLSTSGSGRTAVIEMWGMHYGKTLADRQYGLEHSEGDEDDPDDMVLERYIFQLERFVPNGSGMPSGFPADSWIPYGVFHDCVDNNALNPSNVIEPTVVADGVMNFPHAAFFASLHNANNVPTVRDRLTSVLPTGQTTSTVNTLFLSYGY